MTDLSIDIWAAHFGLTRTPFTKTITVGDLFGRDTHGEAVARIHYCINQNSIAVICGDVGAGKTVAVRAAVAGLDRTKHVVIYLANPAGGCRGIYGAITTALGARPRFHKAEAIAQTMALLAAETDERHRQVTFVIDLCRPRSYPNSGRRVDRRGACGWGGATRRSGWGSHNHRASRKARSLSGGR